MTVVNAVMQPGELEGIAREWAASAIAKEEDARRELAGQLAAGKPANTRLWKSLLVAEAEATPWHLVLGQLNAGADVLRAVRAARHALREALVESGEDFADDLDGAVARIGREGVRHFLRQTKMYGDLDASTVQGEGVDVVSVPLALPERRRLTGVSAPFWVYCEEANGFLIASSDPKKATGEPYRVVGMEVDPEVGRGYRVGRTRDGRSIALGHPGRQFWIALR